MNYLYTSVEVSKLPPIPLRGLPPGGGKKNCCTDMAVSTAPLRGKDVAERQEGGTLHPDASIGEFLD